MEGLLNRRTAFPDEPQNPFASQLDTLIELFNEIDDFEREKDADAEKNKGGWSSEGYGGDSSGGNNAPLLVTMIQRFSIPEPNSSEPSVITQ